MTKLTLILLSSILLAIKQSTTDLPDLTYAVIAIPLFLAFVISAIRAADVMSLVRGGAAHRLHSDTTLPIRMGDWLIWYGPLLTFFILLVIHLDGGSDVKLSYVFIPIWLFETILLVRIGWWMLRFGCGWNMIDHHHTPKTTPTLNRSASSSEAILCECGSHIFGGRFRFIRDLDSYNPRMGGTMLGVFIILTCLIIFEFLLAYRYDHHTSSSSSSHGDVEWSTMEYVCIPLIIASSVFVGLSSASAIQMAQQRPKA